MKLVIGNKNYSSWSLRPWLLLRYFDQAFDEQLISLFSENMREQMAPYCPNYKVPVLIDNKLKVWDSLAICEYINEKYLANAAWPESIEHRAYARAISAEMHAGFTGLRQELPMNCRRIPAAISLSTAAQADISRIIAIWQECLSENSATTNEKDDGNEHFLFGKFSIADVMYMPVVSRFVSYQIEVPASVQEYMALMLNLPAFKQWQKDAIAETAFIEVGN